MAQRLRTIGILGVVTLVALFALIPVAWAAAQNVAVKDNMFDPKTISVNAGDTVTWKIDGQNEHTVTADDGSFDSGDLKAGEKTSFTFSFPKAGTFAYHCKYHGAAGGQGMSGTIEVKAGAAAPAPSGLPKTGGEEYTMSILLAALALLAAGGWLTLRPWRRSA
jgi:LPXTG-motif cell wall-anchored protein